VAKRRVRLTQIPIHGKQTAKNYAGLSLLIVH